LEKPCQQSLGVSPGHIQEYLESLCGHCNNRTICRKIEHSNFGNNAQFNSFTWNYNFRYKKPGIKTLWGYHCRLGNNFRHVLLVIAKHFSKFRKIPHIKDWLFRFNTCPMNKETRFLTGISILTSKKSDNSCGVNNANVMDRDCDRQCL